MESEINPITTVKQFIIVGHPERLGVLKKADKLAKFITKETSVVADFMSTGSTVESMAEKLLTKSVDQIPTAVIILGGDGTVNHALEASRQIDNPNYYNIITNYFGGARDISHNIAASCSNPYALEYNLFAMQEASIHPVEIEINDGNKFTAYNVFSVGRIALMAEQINRTRQNTSIRLRSYRTSKEAIHIAKSKLLKTRSFEAISKHGHYEGLEDLVITNSQRFGIFFRSNNKILERKFGIHQIGKINPEIIKNLLLQKPFIADLNIIGDDEITYNINGQDLRFQIDGEVEKLPDDKTKIALKNAQKPARLLVPR